MSVFTDRAVYWINEFSKNPGGDKNASRPVLPGVGSVWATENPLEATPEFRHTHHITDCITYVTDVMQYAYLDIGNAKMARLVKQASMIYHAMELAKYLATMEAWQAYYWNPDAGLSVDRRDFDADPKLEIGYYCYYNVSPRESDPPFSTQEEATRAFERAYREKFLPLPKEKQDALFETVKRYVNEHTYTAQQAQGIHNYYGVKVTDSITGWLPTKRAKKSFTTIIGHPNDRPKEPPFPSDDEQNLAQKRLAEFGKVRFGFGLARGGHHTFMFSLGRVYEAHWNAGPKDRLYQDRTLPEFCDQGGWGSGVVLVPPDGALNMSLPKA